MSVRCDCGGDHEPWQHRDASAKKIAEGLLDGTWGLTDAEARILATAYLELEKERERDKGRKVFGELAALQARIKELEADLHNGTNLHTHPGLKELNARCWELEEHEEALLDEVAELRHRLTLAEAVVEAARRWHEVGHERCWACDEDQEGEPCTCVDIGDHTKAADEGLHQALHTYDAVRSDYGGRA